MLGQQIGAPGCERELRKCRLLGWWSPRARLERMCPHPHPVLWAAQGSLMLSAFLSESVSVMDD